MVLVRRVCSPALGDARKVHAGVVVGGGHGVVFALGHVHAQTRGQVFILQAGEDDQPAVAAERVGPHHADRHIGEYALAREGGVLGNQPCPQAQRQKQRQQLPGPVVINQAPKALRSALERLAQAGTRLLGSPFWARRSFGASFPALGFFH